MSRSSLFLGLISIFGLINAEESNTAAEEQEDEALDAEEEKQPRFKQYSGIKQNTVFGLKYTINKNTYVDYLTVYQFFNYIKEKLNNRPFTLLDKENQELFSQAIAHFERNARIKAAILKIIDSHPEVALRYKAAQKTADILAKADLLLTCIEVPQEELEELQESLQKQEELSVILTYALLNTESQAQSVLSFIDVVGINLHKTVRENFIEAASEYCKPKTLGGSYTVSQNQVISVLGKEVIGPITSTNEGQYVKVYLPKYKKWAVIYIDKKEKKGYSDSKVAYLGSLRKNQDLITQKVAELNSNRQLEIVKPKFYEDLDSNADTNALLVRVDNKEITLEDLKRVMELLKPNVDVDSLLAKSEPEYRKQFCSQALNIAIRLVVSAILVEENELQTKNNLLYNEYLKSKQEIELTRLLDLHATKAVTRDQIMKEFEAGVQDPERRKYLTDTKKLKGSYLGLENKAILDKLKLLIADSQNKTSNQNLAETMKQLIKEYSIYQVTEGQLNQRFDDRRKKIELFLGELYTLNGSKADTLVVNTFYTAKIPDKEVYHLIYLEAIYNEDVTIPEWTEIQRNAVQKIKEQLMSEVELEIVKP